MKNINLVDDPWIEVLDTKFNQQTVSIKELLQNATNYYMIAGETKSQDLSIMRLVLAILTKVYASDNGLEKWKELYENNSFSDKLFEYLEEVKDKFNLVGDNSFITVSNKFYDRHSNSPTTGTKGKVAFKQINRRISESGNSIQLFSPITGKEKNKLSSEELVRWLVAYQQFTGVTDKAKIEGAKYSADKGWLYRLNPIIIEGENIFETLMLNLNLSQEVSQRPIWEYESYEKYLEHRMNGIVPKNIAELYTLPSRMMTIKELDSDNPQLYVTSLPKLINEENVLDPMSIYQETKDGLKSAARNKENYSKGLWEYFKSEYHLPENILFLKELISSGVIDGGKHLKIENIQLVSDGKATSQMPEIEAKDSIYILASLINDKSIKYVNQKIAQIFEMLRIFWVYSMKVNTNRGLNQQNKAITTKRIEPLKVKITTKFKDWTSEFELDDEYTKELGREIIDETYIIIREAGDNILKSATPKDMKGVMEVEEGVDPSNIFVFYRGFRYLLDKFVDKNIIDLLDEDKWREVR